MTFPRPTAPLALLALTLALAACSDFDRADNAQAAKMRMIGMPREEVLSCMGPPKKKASEGQTEVWSYLSTDGHSSYNGSSYKPTGYAFSTGSHDRSFCTVNIVMKEGVVKAVNYNGPASTTILTPNDQCGYAVANCVNTPAQR